MDEGEWVPNATSLYTFLAAAYMITGTTIKGTVCTDFYINMTSTVEDVSAVVRGLPTYRMGRPMHTILILSSGAFSKNTLQDLFVMGDSIFSHLEVNDPSHL